ncbi:MAG: signal peptidase I [Clostridia bacterium]|nr:signal peptidase I [Clostridia bacterium]
MKIEDLGNEVDALFEEDSVLAQAVVDLQNRRKKISAEKNTTENNISSEEKTAINDSNETDTTSSNAEANTYLLSESEAPVFSAEIAPDKDDGSDLSLFETEALAVNPADVIPYSEEKRPIEEEAKPKKSKLFGRKKKAETEPIKLLDFVANGKNLQKTESPIESEVPPEEDKANDSVSDETNAAASDSADFSDKVSEDSPIEAAPAIIPDADEETSLPETAESLSFDEGGKALGDENSDITENSESEAMSFDADNSLFLTSFDESTPDTEEVGVDKPVEESDESKEVKEEALDTDDYSSSDTVELTESEEATEDAPKKHEEKSRFIDSVFDFVELFIFSLAAVLLITTFFFRHSVVDGSSMEKTLFHGEHIIVSKLFYEPERGDIIVCEDYSVYDKPLVKRIIGIPGDTVKVVNEFWGDKTRVYVNGEELKEDYIYLDGPDFPLDKTWIVGDDEVFVMGDHRNVSKDSRELGTIKIDSIIGKALIRFYPFDNFGKIE